MNVRHMGFTDPIGSEVTVFFGRVRPKDIALVLQDIRRHPELHFHNCNLLEVIRCSSPGGTTSRSLFMAHRYHAPVEYCSYCRHPVPKNTIEQHCEDKHLRSDRSDTDLQRARRIPRGPGGEQQARPLAGRPRTDLPSLLYGPPMIH